MRVFSQQVVTCGVAGVACALTAGAVEEAIINAKAKVEMKNVSISNREIACFARNLFGLFNITLLFFFICTPEIKGFWTSL
ncbi:MAG: hypothetical protein AABX65_02850 [Nanoarchaeota archaeon]